MTEKRIEFNSRLQDIFKDHQVRCLVRYYCSFRDKQYREILQKLAEILYKAERRSL